MKFNILNATIDTYIGFVDDYFNKASLREATPTLQDLKQQFNYTYKQSGKSQTDEFFFVFQCFTALRYSDIKQLMHLTMLRRNNFSEKFVILKTLYTFVA